MTVVLWIAGSLLLLVTALPLLPVDDRFIRAWDFPRLQIAVLLAVVLVASFAVFGVAAWRAILWHGLLALALGYQLYRIYPYTPAHSIQAIKTTMQAAGCDTGGQLRLLIANVRQSNRQSVPVMREIAYADPDLVLLLETDDWWARQVSSLRTRYAHVVDQPQDDGYGMLLFSRLPLIDPRIRFRIDDYVPSIETGVRLRSGDDITFHGVHPKPPPLHDTGKRNAELLIVGRQIGEGSGPPAIVAGDLNDVAWSDTTRLFQKISGLLDPRIGRGFYSTYNANWPVMRWPLDHVFFDPAFRLLDMRRLGYIGSDHFPFYIALCHQPETAGRQNQPRAGPDEKRRAQEQIREGRKDAGEMD